MWNLAKFVILWYGNASNLNLNHHHHSPVQQISIPEESFSYIHVDFVHFLLPMASCTSSPSSTGPPVGWRQSPVFDHDQRLCPGPSSIIKHWLAHFIIPHHLTSVHRACCSRWLSGLPSLLPKDVILPLFKLMS